MTKAKEQSIKEKIKTIALKQNRPFNDVWQEVILERWLSRLAKSKYRKNFIFKGAMCLLRYIDLERETRDLDFLLKDLKGNIDDVRHYLSEVSRVKIDDGFSFDSLDVQPLSHAHMQYPGYAVSVVAHLETTRTKIFIDVGVGDLVKPAEITMLFLSTEKAPLFEKEIKLWAYPVEAIFAEKLETAISHGSQNSRMKDYHDLLLLIRNEIIKVNDIKLAVKSTFENRETKMALILFEPDELTTIQNYWVLYLRTLEDDTKVELPIKIQDVINEINNYLKKNKIL